ncbi:hypothetical protein FOA52_007678 [Chlamydomonas sp. UWO 241]|nr:hypothetical protein FOA52_007678 [Chlamydomonas sp. UWO 241]
MVATRRRQTAATDEPPQMEAAVDAADSPEPALEAPAFGGDDAVVSDAGGDPDALQEPGTAPLAADDSIAPEPESAAPDEADADDVAPDERDELAAASEPGEGQASPEPAAPADAGAATPEDTDMADANAQPTNADAQVAAAAAAADAAPFLEAEADLPADADAANARPEAFSEHQHGTPEPDMQQLLYGDEASDEYDDGDDDGGDGDGGSVGGDTGDGGDVNRMEEEGAGAGGGGEEQGGDAGGGGGGGDAMEAEGGGGAVEKAEGGGDAVKEAESGGKGEGASKGEGDASTAVVTPVRGKRGGARHNIPGAEPFAGGGALRPPAGAAGDKHKGPPLWTQTDRFRVQLSEFRESGCRRSVRLVGKWPLVCAAPESLLPREPELLFNSGKEQWERMESTPMARSLVQKDKGVHVTIIIDRNDGFYLNEACNSVPPDPGFVSNPSYIEGLKRLHATLEKKTIQEIMSSHFNYVVRGQEITTFGAMVNVSSINNKQAWLLNNMRNAMKVFQQTHEGRGKRKRSGADGGPLHTSAQFSACYGLGCWRLAEFGNYQIRAAVQQLPAAKMQWFVYTLGIADYQHISDSVSAWTRQLLRTFAPLEGRIEFFKLVPAPAPNINQKFFSTKRTPLNSAAFVLPGPGPRPMAGGMMGGIMTAGGMIVGGSARGRGGVDAREGREPRARVDAYPERERNTRGGGRLIGGGHIGDGRVVGVPGPDQRGLPTPARESGNYLSGGGRYDARGGGGYLDARGGGGYPDARMSDARGRVADARGGYPDARAGYDAPRGGGGGGGARGGYDAYGAPPPPAAPGGRYDLAPPQQHQHHDHHAPQPMKRAYDDMAYGRPPPPGPPLAPPRGGGYASDPYSRGPPPPVVSDPYREPYGGGGHRDAHAPPAATRARRDEGPPLPRVDYGVPGAHGDYPPARQSDYPPARQGDYPPPGRGGRPPAGGGGGARDEYGRGGGGGSGARTPYGVSPREQRPRERSPPPRGGYTGGGMSAAAPPPPQYDDRGAPPPARGARGEYDAPPPAYGGSDRGGGWGRPADTPADAPPAYDSGGAAAPYGGNRDRRGSGGGGAYGAPPGGDRGGGGGGSGGALGRQQGLPALGGGAGAPRGSAHVLDAGGASLPAPWRAQQAVGALLATPDDARALSSHCITVADGVSATRALGVSSGSYAQALSAAIVAAGEGVVMSAPASGAPPQLKSVIAAAQARVTRPGGAASFCTLLLDPGSGLLHVASIGACGFVLLRPNHGTREMDIASAWRPFTEAASSRRYLCSPDMQPLLGGDDPLSAYEERIMLEPGDLIIAGSHGLFDTVWFHGPTSTNLRREMYQLQEGGPSARTPPGGLAHQLASLGASVAGSNIASSPLAQQLAREGRGLSPVQDVGDVVVVCAWVT